LSREIYQPKRLKSRADPLPTRISPRPTKVFKPLARVNPIFHYVNRGGKL
jgi:hypothetical protein